MSKHHLISFFHPFSIPFPSLQCLCSSNFILHHPALYVLSVACGVSDAQKSCRSGWFEMFLGNGLRLLWDGCGIVQGILTELIESCRDSTRVGEFQRD